MRRYFSSINELLLILVLLALAACPARAEVWEEFIHADDPHHFTTFAWPFVIPELINDEDEVITLSVLVILVEFDDFGHQPQYTPGYYRDMIFGDGTGPWSSQSSTFEQIVETASNGRINVVPALETDDRDDGSLNDGIVGWVTAECPLDWGDGSDVCIGHEDGHDHLCDVIGSAACEAGGGTCVPCDSWVFYSIHKGKRRAEVVRRADPFVPFDLYDLRDSAWHVGSSDGDIRSNELAVLQVQALPTPPTCTDCGAQSAGSNPGAIPVECADPNVPATCSHTVTQKIAVMRPNDPPQVLFHEFVHQVYMGQDCYHSGIGETCFPGVNVLDGSLCYPEAWHGQTSLIPENDECGNAVCLHDRMLWGATEDRVARSPIDNCQGTDVTSCRAGDSEDAWFRYTPSVSTDVNIGMSLDCCGTCQGHMTLAVFDACGGNEVDDVTSSPACTDVAGCGAVTQLTVPMTAGTTYWIRVAYVAGNKKELRYELNLEGGSGTCSYDRDEKWRAQDPDDLTVMSGAWHYMPLLSPWEAMHLGFTKPLVVTEDGTYTIYEAETPRTFSQQTAQPEALLIYDPQRADPYEDYYMLENRTIREYMNQANVRSTGLAVWRVTEGPFGTVTDLWTARAVQLIRPKSFVPITEALWDGSDPDYYDLSATSYPRDTDWTDGLPSYIEIYNISAAGPEMTVKIRLPGVFVDAANTGAQTGSQAYPFKTVAAGADAVDTSGRNQTIRIAGGSYPEGGLVIDHPCTLAHWRDESVTIGQ